MMPRPDASKYAWWNLRAHVLVTSRSHEDDEEWISQVIDYNRLGPESRFRISQTKPEQASDGGGISYLDSRR